MTSAQSTTIHARAILLMVGALFSITLMDVCVKLLAQRVGVLPTLWVRYAGQMLLVALLVAPRLNQVVRTRYLRLQILRSLFLLGTTVFFFTALSLMPIAEAAALMAIDPVLVTLGATFFLGERLGPRRVFGVLAALGGAMIIIRPGSEVFSPVAFLPLIAACCYSGYALLTRRVGPDEDPWTSLFFTCLVGSALLSLAMPFAWQPIDAVSAMLCVALVIFGTVGHLALIRGFSIGEAGMLAPYAYSGLVFSALWGILFFNELPGLATLVGGLVIAGAGIYVWFRETRPH